jgi:ketosteroid isomerase-like protein
MSVEEENTKTALEFLEAFSVGDFDKVLALLADDAIWWAGGSVPGGSGWRTKHDLAAAINGFGDLSTSGGLPTTVLVTVAQGDRVAVEATTNVEFQNGKTYNNEYVYLYRISDGKILKVKEYMDTEHARATFLG